MAATYTDDVTCNHSIGGSLRRMNENIMIYYIYIHIYDDLFISLIT